jgi:hypothetical protein
MLNKSCVVALLAVAATTAVLVAAPRATLILRNGDRVNGDLIDMGGSGFTVRTGGGEKTIATDEVAAIDFQGGPIPGEVATKVQAGRPFVVLRNGDIIDGRLIDIGGTDPLRLTVRTSDGERDFNSNEVSRVVLTRWEGMPASAVKPAEQRTNVNPTEQPTAQPTAQPSTPAQHTLAQGGPGISVPGNPCWTDTGVSVQRNQLVSFQASGEIGLSSNVDDIAGPSGSRTGRYAPNAPLPSVLAGALLGRVANGRPFGIGDQAQALVMPATGKLYLGINDDQCGDNRGEFRVLLVTR